MLVAVAAVDRLATGIPQVDGLPVLIVSGIAALVMTGGALILRGDDEDETDEHDLSIAAVLLDTIADAAAAAGVAAVGAIILATGGWYWLDPAVALAIAVVVAYHAFALMDMRGVVERELRNRYGTDYQIISAGSADDPVRLLAGLRDSQHPVSIVLAGPSLRGMTGTELLAQVRRFHPAAKCLLVTDWGYGPAAAEILQAIALGHIDDYVARPVTVPDERFHLAVTELLEDWAGSNRPRFEVVRVVGEEWSARSHEIRDLLDRNAIPFGFYPVDSEQGQAVLLRPRLPPRIRPPRSPRCQCSSCSTGRCWPTHRIPSWPRRSG